MLKTCLKHDYRAMRKFMGLMMLILLGCFVEIGVASAFYARSIDENHPIMGILSIIALVGGAFAVVGIVTIAYYYTFVDFYQKFFTDQAYLTFTLPVKRSTLYLSKVICGSLAQLVLIATAIVGAFISALIAVIAMPSGSTGGAGSTEPFEPWGFLWVIPVIAVIIAALFFANGLLYLCITIGGTQTRKYKLIAIIGIYYAVVTILSVVGMILIIPLVFGGIAILDPLVEIGGVIKHLGGSAFVMILAMMLGCLGTVLHLVSLGMLERKLNLS